MVLVVIGALGSISKRLGSFLEILDIEALNFYIFTKDCFAIGTAIILRKILQLSECRYIAFRVEVITSPCISTCICD